MSGNDLDLQFFPPSKLRHGEQKAYRIGPAGNSDDDRSALEGHLQPPPFGQQVADEFVHYKGLFGPFRVTGARTSASAENSSLHSNVTYHLSVISYSGTFFGISEK